MKEHSVLHTLDLNIKQSTLVLLNFLFKWKFNYFTCIVETQNTLMRVSHTNKLKSLLDVTSKQQFFKHCTYFFFSFLYFSFLNPQLISSSFTSLSWVCCLLNNAAAIHAKLAQKMRRGLCSTKMYLKKIHSNQCRSAGFLCRGVWEEECVCVFGNVCVRVSEGMSEWVNGWVCAGGGGECVCAFGSVCLWVFYFNR